jgi:hypothetical protein
MSGIAPLPGKDDPAAPAGHPAARAAGSRAPGAQAPDARTLGRRGSGSRAERRLATSRPTAMAASITLLIQYGLGMGQPLCQRPQVRSAPWNGGGDRARPVRLADSTGGAQRPRLAAGRTAFLLGASALRGPGARVPCYLRGETGRGTGEWAPGGCLGDGQPGAGPGDRDRVRACQHGRPGVSKRFHRPHRPGCEVAGAAVAGLYGRVAALARNVSATAEGVQRRHMRDPPEWGSTTWMLSAYLSGHGSMINGNVLS